MLGENASLTLTAVNNGEAVKTAVLSGTAAFLQLTYEWGKTVDARHDFEFTGGSIKVAPEEGSPLSAWEALESISELRVGVAGEPITLVFYSGSDDDTSLTLDASPISVPGPVILRGEEMFRADTDERIAFLNRNGNWQFGDQQFSDVRLSRSMDCGDAVPVAAWTPEEGAQAAGEGWGIFNDNEIQRDDEADAFASDDDAIRWIRFRARSGSRLHQRALDIVRAAMPQRAASESVPAFLRPPGA